MLQPYSRQHNITVIFFTEKYLTLIQDTEYWTQYFKSVGYFQFINIESTAYYTPLPTYGYKWMCKFFTIDIYNYLSQYDYYMRIDTDIYVTKPKYDILKWMEINDIEYAYGLRKFDNHINTSKLLPLYVKDYISQCYTPNTPLSNPPIDTCINYYNNFHMAKISFFLRSDVYNFLSSINSSNNIILHRWGDSTIQAYAIRLYMNTSLVQPIKKFEYVHKSHRVVIRDELAYRIFSENPVSWTNQIYKGSKNRTV
jgi:hypothetical protein